MEAAAAAEERSNEKLTTSYMVHLYAPVSNWRGLSM